MGPKACHCLPLSCILRGAHIPRLGGGGGRPWRTLGRKSADRGLRLFPPSPKISSSFLKALNLPSHTSCPTPRVMYFMPVGVTEEQGPLKPLGSGPRRQHLPGSVDRYGVPSPSPHSWPESQLVQDASVCQGEPWPCLCLPALSLQPRA